MEGGEGWLALSISFCGVASLEGMLGSLLVGHFFVGCGLVGPVFPARLPPLPVLVDSRVKPLPISAAAQRGNCRRPCMLLDRVSSQAPLLAISSFNKNWKGGSLQGGGVVRVTPN